MALRLTIAFSDNPRVQPLKDGAIKPQGIELDFVTLDPSTLFFRNLGCEPDHGPIAPASTMGANISWRHAERGFH